MTNQRPLSFAITRSLQLAVLTVFLALTTLPFAARAQSATATLSGTVEDQNGAVVPGATVTIENVATGLKRQTTTGDQGFFTVPLLPPGTYTVRAQHEGFKLVQLANVVLNVGDQKTLQIPLTTGDVKEVVNVTGEAPLINESPAVSTVVDRQFVGNLPLNGRSFQSLIALAPGTVLAKASGVLPGQFSVNGQRTNANQFAVDGVSANFGVVASVLSESFTGGSIPAFSAYGGTNNLVSVDAMQEFRVQTSTYAPEFGRSPGAQVQIVTRSGTNNFHGTLFDYLRNDVLDANDWFANANGRPKAPERQNDFGGTFSGPILLPRFGEGGRQPGYNGKDRTFFFLSYEGLRLRQPQVRVTEVPTLSLRQTAPLAIQPLLNAFPLPNGANTANSLAQFVGTFSDPTTLNSTSLRIDHVVNQRITAWGRFSHAPSAIVQRGAGSKALSFVQSTVTETNTITVGATVSLTPRLTSDFRANYSRAEGRTNTTLDSFGGATPPPTAALFPAFVTPDDSLSSVLLTFGASATIAAGRSADNFQRQINVTDTVSLVSGNHQLKFGVDYLKLFPIYSPSGYSKQVNFGTLATLLASRATVGAIVSRISRAYPIFNSFSAFAQDTWRLSQRLTFTYGVRWEFDPTPSEAKGNLPATVTGMDSAATVALAPSGTPLWKTTYRDFAPRFGAAYQLLQRQGWETVVRGGFGVFYGLNTDQATTGFGNSPFNAVRVVTNAQYPLTAASEAPVPFTPPFFVVAFDPNLKLPYTLQWNFAIEQSLGPNQTFSSSYVGAVGRRLLVQRRLFANPNPTFTGINLVSNKGTSDYHSLQLQFQRRLSRGLQALASYTWGHSIDDVSNSELDTTGARGPSDFDVRQVFSAALSYNIPSGHLSGIGKQVLGGWGVDSTIRAQSATPVNLSAGTVILSGLSYSLRPNVIAGVPFYLYGSQYPGGRILNNAVPTTAQVAAAGCAPLTATNAKGAFCTPTAGVQGTLGRNALRSFPMWQVDLSLRRQFQLREKISMLFRADIFNVLNHPNFGDPTATLSSGLFGQATSMLNSSLGGGGLSGGLNPLYQIGGPRSIQFSLKLQF